MPSRVPKSTKQLRGTERPDRTITPAPSERLVTIPDPPAGMSEAACAEWRGLASVLVGLKTLTGADLRALQLLAETLASATAFEQIIAKEGATVAAGAGGTKGHPALQALATARAQARGLLQDFGLTPRARQAVETAPAGVADEFDPLAEFLPPTDPRYRPFNFKPAG